MTVTYTLSCASSDSVMNPACGLDNNPALEQLISDQAGGAAVSLTFVSKRINLILLCVPETPDPQAEQRPPITETFILNPGAYSRSITCAGQQADGTRYRNHQLDGQGWDHNKIKKTFQGSETSQTGPAVRRGTPAWNGWASPYTANGTLHVVDHTIVLGDEATWTVDDTYDLTSGWKHTGAAGSSHVFIDSGRSDSEFKEQRGPAFWRVVDESAEALLIIRAGTANSGQCPFCAIAPPYDPARCYSGMSSHGMPPLPGFSLKLADVLGAYSAIDNAMPGKPRFEFDDPIRQAVTH
jgi:hypothetical protein